ncbi:MAG: hypothetical protein R3A47_11135 [Polyangiales bacterium]
MTSTATDTYLRTTTLWNIAGDEAFELELGAEPASVERDVRSVSERGRFER